MRRKLRSLMFAAMTGIAASASTLAFAAADFPSKPIRIIAPSSAGGILDLTSRLIAERLSKQLDGHPVIVENMPGGGGIIGIQGMLRAEPDGHTLVMGSLGPNAANYALYESLPYDTSDFSPVMNVISMPNVLVINPDLPIKTLDDFKSYAESKNGDFSMAISTMGSSGHLNGEMMKHEMGISTINVVYRGAAPAMTDLVSGRVNSMVDNLITSIPMIQAGRIRPVAVFSAERSPLLPDVETVAEQGYPQLVGGTWIGLLVSSKTPADRVQKLNEELNKVLADPGVQEILIQRGGKPIGGTPAEFESFINAEKARWADVIKNAEIKIE